MCWQKKENVKVYFKDNTLLFRPELIALQLVDFNYLELIRPRERPYLIKNGQNIF